MKKKKRKREKRKEEEEEEEGEEACAAERKKWRLTLVGLSLGLTIAQAAGACCLLSATRHDAMRRIYLRGSRLEWLSCRVVSCRIESNRMSLVARSCGHFALRAQKALPAKEQQTQNGTTILGGKNAKTKKRWARGGGGGARISISVSGEALLSKIRPVARKTQKEM